MRVSYTLKILKDSYTYTSISYNCLGTENETLMAKTLNVILWENTKSTRQIVKVQNTVEIV